MKIISNLFVFFSFSSLLFPQVRESIIAKINGEIIFRSDFEKTKTMIIEQYQELSPQILKEKDFESRVNKMAFNKIVGDTLIKQEAERRKKKVTDLEIDNAISEIKSRFKYDKNGNMLSDQEVEKAFNDDLVKRNMTFDDLKSEIQRQLIARKLIEEIVKPKIVKPTDEELKEFYNKILSVMNSTNNTNVEDYYVNIAMKFKELFGERVRLYHIFVKFDNNDFISKNKAFEKINSIRNRINSIDDFEEIAQKESQDTESAKRGGDLGYIIKGMLPKNLEEKAFSINLGEISQPIESELGYHIIVVVEKKIATKPKYDLVKDDIANIIMNKKYAEEFEKYIEELKKQAKIEIFAQELQ